ncbi:MAG: amidohydrolase family protein [Chloroflexi bacterium]|nr:amidohydrolase family protein [Chloroflexota bacterium]MCI0795041.1 amidohydrolase family protein [Chloroflexota bacterium]MCI0799971.1 amidohydrolase family protein [Chloroflexota bacterium]MCI0867906.1 amidohydrolase family protein [Chloroflexota bacterium]MCI0896487.1 amidohydrolase family protein [Chloroflexota bacterium]
MLDMIIKGARIVTPSGVGEWDLGLQGEKIVAVTLPGILPDEGARIIDATGKIVVPGGIEPHAHAAANVQPGARQLVQGTPNAGPIDHSLGAIWGGTTTVIDFAPVPNEGDLAQGIHDFIAPWLGNAYTDYSTHCIYRNSNTPDAISRYKELIDAGFPSVKIFTTDIRPPEGRVHSLTPIGRIDSGRLEDVMTQIARHGGVLAVHGEDDELLMYNYLLAQQRGHWDWYNVHMIHSKAVEDLAFRTVVRLAQRTGVGLYFVHVTASDGLDVISEARSLGMPVYGEVLTLALSFNCENYKEEDGMKYHTYPSLKYEDDRQHLWQGLLKNDLSFTATDSSFTTYLDKIAGRNVVDVRGGNIGIEIRMGVNYSEAVVKQGMSLERYADVTSTNAAKLLGLYPRKGAIMVGSDADIAIIDPSAKKNLSMDDLHVRDYSPWEGWEVEGWPTTVLLRGKVMVDNGQLLGSPNDGQLIPRKIDPAVLQRPAF